ncbi:MAG: hypothetical protein E6G94_06855 [Alphaproteobacteria bacterium]|nr:MAG: hypothetical protein E6G94_06855 [Alphaproteobacteria bacterium]
MSMAARRSSTRLTRRIVSGSITRRSAPGGRSACGCGASASTLTAGAGACSTGGAGAGAMPSIAAPALQRVSSQAMAAMPAMKAMRGRTSSDASERRGRTPISAG